jgi:hypothetical protein
LKISYLITIILLALCLIACGDQWSSKEEAEFIHKCVGGDSDNEKKNDQCKCIFEIVSSEFSYEESKELDSSYSETKYQETEQDSRLKKLQSKIKKCFSKKYPKKNNKSK